MAIYFSLSGWFIRDRASSFVTNYLIYRLCLFVAMTVLFFLLAPFNLLYAQTVALPDDVSTELELTPTLTPVVQGEGRLQLAPELAEYAYGQQVVLTALPDPGWTFVRWESELTPVLPWWDALWDYRVLARVGADGVARTNQPAILNLNFTELLTAMGPNGTFDPASIRVIEIDVEGGIVNANVPFQFEPFGNFDPLNNAAGLLIIGLPGNTAADQTRLFHVYFGLAGPDYPLPGFAPWVTLTAEGIIDEGLDAYKIETLNGTYYYQKAAAGFSSLVDADGIDWIQYSTAPGGSGEFRGIPNAVRPQDDGHLHPGRTSAQSRVIVGGPLRTIIQSDVVDPTSQQLLWSIEWRFYPNRVEATMLANAANFWFLYEGTPGGTIGPEDRLTLADGTTRALADAWSDDLIGPDWAFFSDETASRSLFLFDRSDEEVSHSYRPFIDSGSGDILMTVFGFGRPLSQLAPSFSVSPAYFTLGLADETSFSAVDGVIRAVSTDFSIQYDAPEHRLPRAEALPADNPLELIMTANRIVTAYFASDTYTLSLNIIGEGTGKIVPDPAQSSYRFGTPIVLHAEAAPGSVFTGWSGDVIGEQNPAVITMDGDKTIYAHFGRRVSLTVTTEGQGIVSSIPARDPDDYAAGETVILEPRPADGWSFAGWSGDVIGDETPLALTLSGDTTVIARFGPDQNAIFLPLIER